jgi:hypothetical protein
MVNLIISLFMIYGTSLPAGETVLRLNQYLDGETMSLLCPWYTVVAW